MKREKTTLAERIALAKARRKKAQESKRPTRDSALTEECAEVRKLLPANYDFQLEKSVARLRGSKAKLLALQLPEGLLMFACILSDIFKQLTGVEEVFIFGDVTYGACCIDDYAAKALGCDFLIHYGHSCLIPVDVTKKPSHKDDIPLSLLYVFVDIKFEVNHMVECIRLTLPDSGLVKLHLLGTIQFAGCLSLAKEALAGSGYEVEVPQGKPLSRGEVLGCSSPTLEIASPALQSSNPAGEGRDSTVSTKVVKQDIMIFVADGRFHMESAMIANPTIPSYQYNPYDKKLTLEGYDVGLLKQNRMSEIIRARAGQKWCIIMGTLGRQGNPGIVRRLKKLLSDSNKPYIVLLLSEAFPSKLRLLQDEVDCFVQVCCPRLSIDWGLSYHKPLLTPYECFVVFDKEVFREQYPQDYYLRDSGPWTNYYSERTG